MIKTIHLKSDPIIFKVDNFDGIAPSGFITYPYAGQNVSGIITILAEAEDNVGIDKFNFQLMIPLF